MPKEITPQKVGSINNAASAIMDDSYYKKIGRFIGGQKRKTKFNPLHYKPGYEIVVSSYENDVTKMIKESVVSKLMKKQINKYMSTPDGRALQTAVNDIIKGKMSDRKKKI
jgi:hypothetical protein